MTQTNLNRVETQTYIKAFSQQPGILISGLSTLLVSACDHMRDCHRESVCCSADAQHPRTRVDNDDEIALYLL